MKTGNVPTTNGGTLTLDQAARAAVAGMGHVFADPAIEGQQAFARPRHSRGNAGACLTFTE